MSDRLTRAAQLFGVILLHLSSLCLASGNLTVRLIRYHHAADRLSDGSWCDKFLIGKSSSCDPQITVCLGSMRTTCDLLHSDYRVLKNTVHFDWSQEPERAPTFVLRRETIPPLVFLKITVRDFDHLSRDHDLIATFHHTFSTPMGKTKKLDLMSEDNDDISDLEIQVSAQCDSNYFGRRCDKFCRARYANQVCTSKGERRCRRGFYGAKCAFQTCVAANSCQNGGRCQQGPRGQICHCPSDAVGPRCEIKNPCLSGPCQNRGVCSWPRKSKDFRCRCNEHFIGVFCEKFEPCLSDVLCQKFVPCLSNPCLNGGKCAPSTAGSQALWKCTCRSGFQPPRCSVPDLCSSRPCLNGGNCSSHVRDGKAEFQCRCPPDFTGNTCQDRSDPCHSLVCLNDGVCKLNSSAPDWSAFCQCPPGVFGSLCEKKSVQPRGIKTERSKKEAAPLTRRKVLNTAVIVILAVGGVSFLTLIGAVVAITRRRKRRKRRGCDSPDDKLLQDSVRTEEVSTVSSRSVPLPRRDEVLEEEEEEVEQPRFDDSHPDDNQVAFL